jgi:hypothetical protein
MFDGTISCNSEPINSLSLEEILLVRKVEEERESIPEGFLFAESTLESLRDCIETPGTTRDGRILMSEASQRPGLAPIEQIFFGIPVFTISDRDARIVPINPAEIRNGEKVIFMGTENILAGSIESIQKILRWLSLVNKSHEWRPWMKFHLMLP